MSDQPKWKPGDIVWRDLTVPDAASIRDFYSAVVGWGSAGEDMGGYEDYSMLPEGSTDGIAGICHARGSNAGIPPQWLMYIAVSDLKASIARCVELGGKVIDGPRSLGSCDFCVIQDPAGAVCALAQTSG